MDSTLEFINLHINVHQDHVFDLRLHVEKNVIFIQQSHLKNMTTTPKPFHNQEKNLKLLCIPLK